MQFIMPFSSYSCQKQLPTAASRLKAFNFKIEKGERKKEKVLTVVVGVNLYAIQ